MGASEVPLEEIRFAVVLNGGVSLAVWMGGVVRELDRLTGGGGTHGRGPYHCLLRMVGATARADVIAGTSAGGINGAALALAQVNQNADLNVLRDIWAEQGRMESLLRQPFRGAPASLLQGDEYFLPQLRQALNRLAADYDPRKTYERPIDLTITTTLLEGSQKVTVDSLGQELPQTVHDGRFTFGRDPEDAVLPGKEPRAHFDPEEIQQTVKRLAVAARSSASFPIAFEPSFVPVNEASDTAASPDTEEDMGEVASWSKAGNGQTPDRSRFAVDGGVLVNTPTEAVLEAVARMPAAGPVRRIVLLVFPHASEPATERPAVRAEPPALAKTLSRIRAAQSSQGGLTHVEEVHKHNVRAAARRAGRIDVISALETPQPNMPDPLERTVQSLQPHYRQLRIRRAARDLAIRVPAQPEWPYERVRAAAEAAQRDWAAPLPYVPGGEVLDGVEKIFESDAGWAWGVDTARRLTESVVDLLKRLVWVCQSADYRVIARQREQLNQIEGELRTLRHHIDNIWVEDTRLKQLAPDRDYWTLRLAAYAYAMLGKDQWSAVPGSVADLRQHVERLIKEAEKQVGGSIGELVRQQVVEIGRIAARAVRVLGTLNPDSPAVGPLGADLKPWQTLLCDGTAPEAGDIAAGDGEAEPSEAEQKRVLRRLLGLEVLTRCLAEDKETGAGLPMELVQISLQTRNAFASYSLTPDDKGAGMALGRFSGFLKQSWRLNDWTWGRLDAATMLCRTILDPSRLRRVAALTGRLPALEQAGGAQRRRAEELAAETVRDLLNDIFGATAAQQMLAGEAAESRLNELVGAAVADLVDVFDPTVPLESLPRSAPHLADLAAWGIHAGIAVEELPPLARAVGADQVEGANQRSRGALFVAANDGLIKQLAALPPEAHANGYLPDPERVTLGMAALEAFDRAGIGHEALSEEGASDQLIRTAVTAAGVGVTVLDGDGFGIRATKPFTRVLRGAALLPYWATVGLTGGGVIARFLAILGIAVGGVLAVLALFGALPELAAGPAAALGAATLLTVFGYAALRSGTLTHGLVLLSPVIPLIVYATGLSLRRNPDDAAAAAGQGLSVVVVIALVAAGLAILASLPAGFGGPWQFLKRRWPYLAALATLALLAAFSPQVVGRVAGRFNELLAWLPEQPWYDTVAGWPWPVLGWVAAALAGIAGLEVRLIWTGRRWQADPDPKQPWRLGPFSQAVPAAQWCWLYGGGYGIATVVVLGWAGWPERDWQLWLWAILATTVSFAAVLLIVAPWWLPLRERAAVRATLVGEAAAVVYDAAQPVDERLVNRLLQRGEAYRFLVQGPPKAPNLTRYGRRVAQEIQDKLAAANEAAAQP